MNLKPHKMCGIYQDEMEFPIKPRSARNAASSKWLAVYRFVRCFEATLSLFLS
jgi:hypothetical protein